MSEGDPGEMNCRSVDQGLFRFGSLASVFPFQLGEHQQISAVERISHDRLLGRLKVHTDLVGAKGFGVALKELPSAVSFLYFDPRFGLFSFGAIDPHHPVPCRMRGKLEVDCERVVGSIAVGDHRELKFYLTGADEVSHGCKYFLVGRKKSDSRGLKIECIEDVKEAVLALAIPSR